MDFETTFLNGSQLLQQFQSTLAQYAPDYAEEARQYEQAKDSLPEVIRLEKLMLLLSGRLYGACRLPLT